MSTPSAPAGQSRLGRLRALRVGRLPLWARRAVAVACAGVLTSGAIVTAPSLTSTASASAFTECPAIGQDTGCAYLITIANDGTVSVQHDPKQGPFDGHDDTLVGVVNNSSVPIPSLSLSSSSGIFDFDGDGICSFDWTPTPTLPGPSYCPKDSSGAPEYAGPNNTYSNYSAADHDRTGSVDFTGAGLGAGASTFFSLESSPLDSVGFPTRLSIAKTHAGSFAYGSSSASYALAVTNAGEPSSGAVTVTDTLPAGETFLSGSGGGFACTAAGNVVTCTTTDPILIGSPDLITLDVRVTANAFTDGHPTALANQAFVTLAATENTTPSNTDEVTVTPAALYVSPMHESMPFGGTVPTIPATYSGFVNGDDASSLTAPATCSALDGSDLPVSSSTPAGHYVSTCSGAIDSNYTITYGPGTFDVTPAPDAAPLKVIASDATMTYGGTPPTVTASFANTTGVDTSTSLPSASVQPTCTSNATSATPAGVYASLSSCSGVVDTNYAAIDYVNGSVTVQPAPLVIRPADTVMTAGSTPPTIAPTYTSFVNGDSASSLSTPPTCGATDASNNPVTSSTPPGTYTETCTGAVDSNYAITYTTGTLTIAGATTLVITASSPTMHYGDTPPSITPSYSAPTGAGFVAPSCSTTAASSSPVGNYPATCSGAVDPNFSGIVYVAGTVQVQPAPLTITASSYVRHFGDPTPTVHPIYAGLRNGDTAPSTPPVCSTGVGSATPVGTYPSTCSGAADPDYVITYVPGTIEVDPSALPLTITASSASIVEGQPVPAVTPIFGDTLGPDTMTSLPSASTQPSCTSNAGTSPSYAGSPYTTSCSGAVDANYSSIVYVDGRLNVLPTPAALTITKSHVGNFVSGENGTYLLTIADTGEAPSPSTTTVTDTLPAGETFVAGSGGGFTCGAVGQLMTCTTDTAIANGTPVVLTVTVGVTAVSGTVLTNAATVACASQPFATRIGTPIFRATCTGSPSNVDTVTVQPMPAMLTVAKSHVGTFVSGSTGVYDLVVTNVGGSTTTDSVLISDTLPAGETFVSGAGTNGFTCAAAGQLVTCSSTSGIAPAASATVTLTVRITAAGGTVLSNQATASPNGSISNTDTVTVTAGPSTTTTLATGLTTTTSTIVVTKTNHSKPPPSKVIGGVTTVHTGEPWAGARPYLFAAFLLGLVLLGLGTATGRRRRINGLA